MTYEQNQRIEVAHSQEEMLRILDYLRGDGFHYKDIHIITKDPTRFEEVKGDTDVITHAAGNWVDQFKSWFTGESAVTEGLKRFALTDGQIALYAQWLEQGAIVLYTEQANVRNNVQESQITASKPFDDTIDHATTSPQREGSSQLEAKIEKDNNYRRSI